MTWMRTKKGSLVTGPPELIRRFLAQGATLTTTREPHTVLPQGLGRRARVLVVAHGWMPYLAAGSERMMQHLVDALPSEEFEVQVLSLGCADDRERQDPYTYEGTRVQVGFKTDFTPDVIITHHGPAARVTQDLSVEFPDARVVAVYHNERFDIPDIHSLNPELAVFNTRWVQGSLDKPGIVVHPPIERARHQVPDTGNKITLVNLQYNKGVETFAALAERMPEFEFLGVVGTHGTQELQLVKDLDNVTIMETTQNMKHCWEQSRIVLMPSAYESYGMVAAEALISGIPVLAHPTDGLVECLDWAGVFIDRDDHAAYERTVRLLMTDPGHYDELSRCAFERGCELEQQTAEELGVFVEKMRGLV